MAAPREGSEGAPRPRSRAPPGRPRLRWERATRSRAASSSTPGVDSTGQRRGSLPRRSISNNRRNQAYGGVCRPHSAALGPRSARTRRARLPALTRHPARGPHRQVLPRPAAAADQGRARSRHRRPHPSRAPPPQLRTRARSSAPGPALLCPRGAPPGVRRSAGSCLRALDRGGPCLTPAPPATALVARPRGAGRPSAPGRTPLRDAAPRHGSKGKNSRVTGFPTRPAPPAPQDPSRARATENAPPGPGSHLSRRSSRPPGLALHSHSAARRATVSADPAPSLPRPSPHPSPRLTSALLPTLWLRPRPHRAFPRPNFDRASHSDPAPSALRPAFALAPPPPSTFSVPRLRHISPPAQLLPPPLSPPLALTPPLRSRPSEEKFGTSERQRSQALPFPARLSMRPRPSAVPGDRWARCAGSRVVRGPVTARGSRSKAPPHPEEGEPQSPLARGGDAPWLQERRGTVTCAGLPVSPYRLWEILLVEGLRN
ncbi:proline-rich protein 36-like [Mustela erminea]|uniref:proline-rich protein 36-like n=1 Tax=Mustela erminea TaxID=36723 RepID=UPI001386E516|nr:proline-rich protein 36-like [Mustela erminea]